MTYVMLRYDETVDGMPELLMQYARACMKAQELEMHLHAFLQYSLALAGDFDGIESLEQSNDKHGNISMGLVLEKAREYFLDDALADLMESCRLTRNDLVHKLFKRGQGGARATEEEMIQAISFCRTAAEEFDVVIETLDDRVESIRVLIASNPNAFIRDLSSRFD